MPPIKHIENRN